MRLEVSQGAADLGFLSIKGVNAVILGPGEKDQAHKEDEYCYYEQVKEAVEVYGKIVETWVRL